MVPVVIINSEIGFSESTGLHVIENKEPEVEIKKQEPASKLMFHEYLSRSSSITGLSTTRNERSSLQQMKCRTGLCVGDEFCVLMAKIQ